MTVVDGSPVRPAPPRLVLTLRPHLERDGYHLDRFDTYLDDKLIVTSRQPLYDGARTLLARGYDPDALLTMRHHGKGHDSFKPRPIGELAKWTYEETSAGGIKRRGWKPFDASRLGDGAARTADDRLAGVRVPGLGIAA